MHHTPRLRRPPPSSAALPIAIRGSIWCSFAAAYGVCETTSQSSSLSSCGSVYRVSHFTNVISPRPFIPSRGPGRRQVPFGLGFDSLRFGICPLYRQSGRASFRREMVVFCLFFSRSFMRSFSFHPPNRFPLLVLLPLHYRVLILISSLRFFCNRLSAQQSGSINFFSLQFVQTRLHPASGTTIGTLLP
ncbi:hypothetical protein B0H13DRAFT_2325268 [Mycena leptocephala]|nr:hypothetical protein B0H13DRAFT_2325268 [Mycena leptocephala]